VKLLPEYGLTDRNKKGQTPTGDLLEGFCGISRRQGQKPIIAAVNGYAFGTIFFQLNLTRFIAGGGFEMVVNWS